MRGAIVWQQTSAGNGCRVQNTLRQKVRIDGVGLHSGARVRMELCPAPQDFGIVFERSDVLGLDARIPARWDHVVASRLCTLIRNDAGVSVSTIEHVMAALAGCGVQNALIRVDGPEAPIMDGSARPFVQAILRAGLQPQGGVLRALRILRAVEVTEGEAFARLEPHPAMEIDFHIDFTDAVIGRQRRVLNMANGAFLRELADSRTFCRRTEVEAMRANGLALGGTLENAIVVDGADILSPGGLRHADEPVRHKMLDALGDLALAGAPVLGRYVGHRAGHALTNRLLHAVFADAQAWEWIECDSTLAALLPGSDLKPADYAAVA
jgi:UDP-3-O-[3-hydroxymyristoyl] N-acetylglucosamine deacetylase